MVLWGEDLIQLYNEACLPILGFKHPASMGMPGRDTWPEVWDFVGPMLEERVFNKAESTLSENQLMLLNRNGYIEECYFNFSFSPIYNESNKVEGVFCTVQECSAHVISERRMQTLQSLSVALS